MIFRKVAFMPLSVTPIVPEMDLCVSRKISCCSGKPLGTTLLRAVLAQLRHGIPQGEALHCRAATIDVHSHRKVDPL